MQINTKFPVAVHVLLAVLRFGAERRTTSDFIASSVNTNPAVIRKIMGLLSRAGLIEVAAGTGGIALTRDPARITLLDVYLAVESEPGVPLFRIHEDPEPRCPVGSRIEGLLAPRLAAAQRALEADLSRTSLAELIGELGCPQAAAADAASPV